MPVKVIANLKKVISCKELNDVWHMKSTGCEISKFLGYLSDQPFFIQFSEHGSFCGMYIYIYVLINIFGFIVLLLVYFFRQ